MPYRPCTDKTQVPLGKHYAILVYKQDSIFIPGDERSRRNPGHGYPERYEVVNSCEHFVFTDQNEFMAEVKKRHQKGENFVFFVVNGLGSIQEKIQVLGLHEDFQP